MPDYQKTKIYKIWSPNSEKVYVGATVQTLAQRMGKHRTPTSNTSSSKIIIDLGDARIELLEEFPCNNKMESDRKEGEYIRNLNCVNKNIAGRTIKEYRFDNKEKINEETKQYNFNSKERHAKWYLENKERIKNTYNKDKKSEYNKTYREANLEKVKAQNKASKDRAKAKAKLEKEQSLI